MNKLNVPKEFDLALSLSGEEKFQLAYVASNRRVRKPEAALLSGDIDSRALTALAKHKLIRILLLSKADSRRIQP